MDNKKVKKLLQFNHNVSVILIPNWRELKTANIFNSIWYDSDFFILEKQHFQNEICKYSKDNNISIEESYSKIYK
jgi:hypothetical protein